MRTRSIAKCVPAAAAIAAAAGMLMIAPQAAAQERAVIAQSLDDPEDLLPPIHFPRPRAQPRGEPGRGNPYGVSRRMDAFDRLEQEGSGAARASGTGTGSNDGQVICEAGCDGPRGTVVYKSRKPVASLAQ